MYLDYHFSFELTSHSLPCCVTVPGPPTCVVVGCIVICQPPQTPNGNLLGYDIRVYPEGSEGQAQIVNKTADEFYHVLTDVNLPAKGNLRVQVTRTNMVVMIHNYASQLVPASS